MPICKDPLVTHLKKLGMNVVYPPRSNLVPLELMLKEGKELVRWGNTTDAFKSNREVPKVKTNVTVNSISGDITAKHDLSVGLSILGTVLGQVGAKLGLKAAYKNAKTLKFIYEGITSEYCDPLKIDQYLNDSTFDDSSVSTEEYLKSDSLYVVSEIFRSNRIRVEAQDESGASLEIDVPEIQQVGSGNLKVSSDETKNSVLVYEGETPVTFGIRALKIDYVSKGNRVKYKLIKVKSGLKARSAAALLESTVSYEALEEEFTMREPDM